MKNVKKINRLLEEFNLIDAKLKEIDKAAHKIIKENKEVTLFMECEKTPEKSDIIDSDGSLIDKNKPQTFGFFSFSTNDKSEKKEQLINQVVAQEQIFEIFGVLMEPLVIRRGEIINSLKQLGVHA